MEDYKERTKNLLAELERFEVAEKSLISFMRLVWPEVAGGALFQENWHIEAIAEHLEALHKRQIRNLLINIPPRCTKSLLCSVVFPAWVWTHTPSEQFLCTSYSKDLSFDSATKSRRLLGSRLYQRGWGNRFKIMDDQDAKGKFDNDKFGYRFTTSIDATTTGWGGSCILVDDPNSARDVSEQQLNSALKWWTEVMPTRGNDPKSVIRLLIQQRVHEKDVSGHVLTNDNSNEWTKLILPMEFEPSRRSVTVPLKSTGGKKWQDPREKPGELLWPSRVGSKELDILKRELSSSGSSYAIAGQLQQRPAPESGGIYKREWFKLWPADEPFPKFDYVIASYDTAYTDVEKNDPTACTVWGVFNHPKDRRPCAMLLDCYADWIDYPDLRRRIESDYAIKYGPKGEGKKPDFIIIETKGSGDALFRDLKRTTAMPVIGYNPGNKGKKQRARIVSYLFENGMIFLPESENNKGRPKSWCEDFLNQMCTYPNSDHDDYVDSTSQAMIHLKDRSLLNVYKTPEPEDRDVAEAIHRQEVGSVNPYAV